MADFQDCRAVIFDLMGTCTDWHSALLPAITSLPSLAPPLLITPSDLLLQWRLGFFEEIHSRFERGEDPEDIDVTHRRVLDRIIGEREGWSDGQRDVLVKGWHKQVGWPDSKPGIDRLRQKFDVVVLANGTTRLQLDVVRSSGLLFHSLFSSQLLGLTKPDPLIYHRAVSLLGLHPHQCVMVAAHAYDVRAAKAVGMKTIYIQRWTEDPDLNMSILRKEFDAFVDGRNTTSTGGGLISVADCLGA
ncbi:haloacid dehalogenase [Irpex rosettiformis]|uniref:Haloacid dehalogenase n=1 Tax=Irpex rosettiformis TaxID=378272 RepID=A0ACB8U0Q4_9APHY|nr:haloacid dehalogenase [Irpex rosettiformis]